MTINTAPTMENQQVPTTPEEAPQPPEAPAVPTPDEVLGTGVAAAARPSTKESLEAKEGDMTIEMMIPNTPPKQQCESSAVTLAGCSRVRLSGLSCVGRDMDKYFLSGWRC